MKSQVLHRWQRAWGEDGWLRPYLGRYRKALLASLGLGILTMIFAVGLMFTSGYLISDAAEEPELGLFSILVPLGLVQVFGLGKPFLSYFERIQSHDWVLRLTSTMRKRLYCAIEDEGMFWTATHRAGDALGLLANDIGHVQNLYLRTVFPLVISWMLWVIVVVCIGVFSVAFALFMALELLVLTVLMPLVSVLHNGARQMRAKQLQSQFYGSSYDNIAGIADWAFSGRRSDYIETVVDAEAQLNSVQAATAKTLRIHDLIVSLFFVLASAALLVWTALHFGTTAQADAASGVAGRPADLIAAFVLGFFPLMEAFSPLPRATLEAGSHLDSIERLNQLDAPSEDKTRKTPQISNAPLLSVKDLHFSYPGEAELVRGVSLDIPQGTKVMVLGPSGSGKSTLASLIRGDLMPCSGTVSLDAVPTASFGDSICQHVAFVQQNTYLFNKTLYSNLTLGDKSISKEQAVKALETVGLGALLQRLPKGIDTVADEDGLNFSGGEGHRIALARVLLRNAPIVIFDEPTVALDPITEQSLLNCIFSVLEGRTIILITHHLACVEEMDRVVFLEQGTIAIDGTPHDLRASSPRFRRLLNFDRGML